MRPAPCFLGPRLHDTLGRRCASLNRIVHYDTRLCSMSLRDTLTTHLGAPCTRYRLNAPANNAASSDSGSRPSKATSHRGPRLRTPSMRDLASGTPRLETEVPPSESDPLLGTAGCDPARPRDVWPFSITCGSALSPAATTALGPETLLRRTLPDTLASRLSNVDSSSFGIS